MDYTAWLVDGGILLALFVALAYAIRKAVMPGKPEKKPSTGPG